MDIQVLKWIHTASAIVVPIIQQQIVYPFIFTVGAGDHVLFHAVCKTAHQVSFLQK